MKAFTTLCATSALILNSGLALEMTKEEKDASFFEGLEQGFFLRKDEKGHKQFDCPDLAVDSDLQKKFNSVMQPA